MNRTRCILAGSFASANVRETRDGKPVPYDLSVKEYDGCKRKYPHPSPPSPAGRSGGRVHLPSFCHRQGDEQVVRFIGYRLLSCSAPAELFFCYSVPERAFYSLFLSGRILQSAGQYSILKLKTVPVTKRKDGILHASYRHPQKRTFQT